ncbi:MAG: SHOCT domain-containing protein [Firmicutes bacterium]|nr:SHOCT domain-containing protein [Bacillota bacterium]
MMGFGRGWEMGYGMHSIGGVIMMILFWALIIIGIVYLVRNLTNNNRNDNYNNRANRSQDDNAVNIARERYARGEITKEELNEILDDLRQY